MIKRQPEDFFVEEILAPEIVSRISGKADARGSFGLYRLTKRNLGTDEALEQVAGRLGLPPGRLCYGGLKDRHALTVQYISIDLPRGGAGPVPGPVETPRWKLEPVGRLKRPISSRDVAGNRFRITVRDLTRRRCEGMAGARRFLSLPAPRGGRTLLLPNYYGDQRFGSARHGLGFAARRLIEGDFEEALRLLVAIPDRKDSRERKAIKRTIAAGWGHWSELARVLPPSPERIVAACLAKTGGDFRAGFSALPHLVKQIAIEAYQSRLWNEVARRLIVRRCPPPLLKAPARFGDFVFPFSASIGAELASTGIPLFSPRTALHEPWKDEAGAVLAEEGIALRDLRVPGMRTPYFGEVPRRLFVEALEFSLGPVEADESTEGAERLKRRVRFFLPRGAYGTVLLGALGAADQSILR